MKLYRVNEWDEHYENNKSRERIECSYVCVPNSQGGLGFSRIMAQRDGAAIYGIWCLILGAASRQRRVQGKGREGWLTDDGHQTGTPWTAIDLALLWRRDAKEIERALDFLSSPAIGWLSVIESNDSTIVTPDGHQAGTQRAQGVLERKKERIEEKAPLTLPASLDTPAFRETWATWEAHRKSLRKPLTPQAIKGQIADCEKWGLRGAIESIQKSIKSGWSGLFEPDSLRQPLLPGANQNFKPVPPPVTE